MNMMKKNISYILIGTGLLLSCNDKEIQYINDVVPIQLQGTISQSIADETRAATTLYNSFYGGEQIDVSIYNGSAVDANKVIGKENIVYTIADDGKMTPPTDMQPYFPVTANGAVTIRASYPKSENPTTTSVTVAADQTSDNAYKQGELLWATLNATRTTGTNALQLLFHHRMSKIIVKLTSRNGVPVLPTTVKLLQFKPTATLTKSTGAVAASGNAIDIVMTTNGAAMVPPQTIAANTPIFEIVTAQGDIARYSSPTALVFKPDYIYTYDVQVDMRNVTVVSTITTWGGNTTYTNQKLEGDS